MPVAKPGGDLQSEGLPGSGEPTRLLRALREALLPQEDVGFAYLFGSVAKGRARRTSDVDVAVWFSSVDPERPDNRVALIDRSLQLASDLARAVNRPVDAVALNLAPLDLAHNILRHGRLILSRDEAARTRFYVDHVHRYLDMAPARAILTAAMLRRIKEGRFGHGGGHGPPASRDH